MKKDILFTLPSYFRDDMNIMAYRFGKGEKTCAVVGALRGDEVQQLYVCARLVSFLREVEKEDGVQPGKSVMIVPTVIGASMNEGSRLWEPENMDINRRFPGDVTGSTTERIAGALLDRLKNYRYGVQLTSFYQPGGRTLIWAANSACRMSMSAPRAATTRRPSTTTGSSAARRHIPSTRAKRAKLTKRRRIKRCAPSSVSSTAAGSSAAKPLPAIRQPSSPTRI